MLNNQFSKFPSSRFMGSKTKLITRIWDTIKEKKFHTVLDAFSGSNVVSYYLKTQNKSVYSNDFMSYCFINSKAIIENSDIKLSNEELALLLSNTNSNRFVQNTFANIYYNDADNKFIDQVRGNIDFLENDYSKAIALSALCRSCIKKRPRGIFTYTGFRYNDNRKDLLKTFNQHFLESVSIINNAVFSNHSKNTSTNKDIFDVDFNPDLVYFDPPYYSTKSDNDYTRRYHFLEGLVKNWEGLNIIHSTKTKKFKKYPSDFGSKNTIYGAFDRLFKKYCNSIIVVSYSSNSIPTKYEMIEKLKQFKSKVSAIELDHTYSFGNHKGVSQEKSNYVKEYLFIGE